MPRDLVLGVVGDLDHVLRLGHRVPLYRGGVVVDGYDIRPHHAGGLSRGQGGIEIDLLTLDIEDVGGGLLLGLSNQGLFPGLDLSDLGLGIVQISSDDAVGGADHHACWLHSDRDPVLAVVALGCCAGVWVDVDGIVWTGLQTCLAANAEICIEADDAIFLLVHGCDRTDRHAGWILTVVAAGDLKVAICVGVLTRFRVLDPGSIDPDGDLVFRLAGNRTCMAADAASVVDDKAVVHA